MEYKRTDNTLLDLITLFRKHILGMQIVFVCVVLVATIITYKQTPIYEVGSRVLVKYGRENQYRSIQQLKDSDVIVSQYNYNPDKVINTELEILKSAELAEEVVTAIGVEKLYPDLALNAEDNASILPFAVSSFVAMLDAFHVKGSSVIGVAFQHQDPHIAVQAVSHLVERFKERHLEIYKDPQVSFLAQQVTRYRQQLQDVEEAIVRFKQEHQVFDLPEQRKMLMYQYVTMSTSLVNENSALDESTERMTSIEKQLETVTEDIVQFEDSSKGTNLDSSEATLLQLKLKEHDLLEMYSEGNRLVVAVRQDIKMVEDFLAAHKTKRKNIRTGKNPLYFELEKDLLEIKGNFAGQETKIESLIRQIDLLKDRLQDMSKLEIELNSLNEQLQSIDSVYKKLDEKLGMARIQEAMDTQKMVNIVVIDKPRLPLRPIKPRKKLAVLVGVILGVACSLFYVLFAESVMARKN